MITELFKACFTGPVSYRIFSAIIAFLILVWVYWGFRIAGRSNKDNIPAQYKILNSAQSKASLSKCQSIPPNQQVNVKFDTEIFDTHGEFYPENGWHASRRSLYKVDLNLQIGKITEKTKIIVMIRASNESFFEEFNISPEDTGKIKLVKSVDTDAYDTIDILIQHNYKKNISIINNPKLTYLLIEETDKRI